MVVVVVIMGWSLGRGLIMKFKNVCISTEAKAFYPHEKCRTHVNKNDLRRIVTSFVT